MIPKGIAFNRGQEYRLKKILDSLDANGSPKPEFEKDGDRSYFITRLFIHEGFEREANERKSDSRMNEVPIDETKNETSFETKRLQKVGAGYR